MHRLMAGLGWRPGDVWSATPREILAALSPAADGQVISRSVLAGLMAAAPDAAKGEDRRDDHARQ
ncbi:hypothetical protein GCM10011316_23840 [Roseibium aquae]|uniref:Phage tail assembly chaperone n=1 Tax=Roseibium aquae TaxID=1323746 RepID=A0A916X231_9HYPH|nr:phage tail assembly chaperone [Roseibium aquae]GGB51003.1 hypothetical protein GCM10011316_23840 [Roseibium aquae]